MMTPRQSFAIFCKSGYDVRACQPTREQIDSVFASNDAASIVANWPGAILKRQAKPSVNWQELYDKAHAAGMAAVSELQVVPMVVQQHANPIDDNSPVVKSYFVADGVCGFAQVSIRPGNSPFANWLKKTGLGKTDSYAGGVYIWIGDFNQSLQKKETYAYAFAKVLRDAGIRAYASSRMD